MIPMKNGYQKSLYALIGLSRDCIKHKRYSYYSTGQSQYDSKILKPMQDDSHRLFNGKAPKSSTPLILPEPRKSKKSDKPLTSNERDIQMRNLAFLLQSLRSQKSYDSFLQSNGPSTDERLLWNCQKVIKYYAEPNRFLPLQPYTKPHESHQGLVLQGPLLCHSLLTDVLIPYFISKKSSIPESFSDNFIDMGLMTIRSIGELCDSSKNTTKTKRHQYTGIHDIDENGNFLQLGQLAEDLLRLLLNMEYMMTSKGHCQESLSKRSRKTTFLFNTTLNTWAKIALSERDHSAAKNAALGAEKLLLDLALSQNKKNDTRSKIDSVYTLIDHIQPDSISFNSVIQSWSNSGRYKYIDGVKRDISTTFAAERAEAILHLMQDMSMSSVSRNNGFIHPNNVSYDLTIHAWTRAMHQHASDRAIDILVSMLENFHASQRDMSLMGKQPFPSRETFSTVLKSLATSDRSDSIEKGEEIFCRMKLLGEQGYAQCKPDTIAYNSLLSIYLRKLMIITEKGKGTLSEMSDAFKLCLRMDEIVDDMTTLNSRKDKITKEKTSPDTATLRTVGKAWMTLTIKGATSQNASFLEESLKRSDSYLRLLIGSLESEVRHTPLGIASDKKLFNQLIFVYNKVGYHLKADAFEKFVHKSSSSVANSLKRDKIEELTNSASRYPENAEKADKILQSSNTRSKLPPSQPNAYVIRSVFNSYSRLFDSNNISSDDALKYIHRMEELLKVMETMFKTAILKKPDMEQNRRTLITASNVLLRSYIKGAENSNLDRRILLEKAEANLNLRLQKDHCAPPDAFTFTQMMVLLSKCRQQNSSKKSLEILEKVRNMPDVKVDIYFFNTTFKAISSNPGYELEFEKLLTELENGTFYRSTDMRLNNPLIKPDKITYNTLMAYYANKGTVESAEKVEQLYLKLCVENSPDTYCLNTLIKAWCQVGTLQSVERAETLLSRSMPKDCYFDSSDCHDDDLSYINPSMKPNLTSFNLILQGYARLKGRKAIENANRVQRLQEEYLKTYCTAD